MDFPKEIFIPAEALLNNKISISEKFIFGFLFTTIKNDLRYRKITDYELGKIFNLPVEKVASCINHLVNSSYISIKNEKYRKIYINPYYQKKYKKLLIKYNKLESQYKNQEVNYDS